MYSQKLLEFLYIENTIETAHIIVNLKLGQDEIQLRWEIDQYTANHLKMLEKQDENCKYRLSLRSFWDSTLDQYYCCLTKTYRNQSEKLHFHCSETFIACLKSIKNIDNLSDLTALQHPFITILPNECIFTNDEEAKPTYKSRIVVAMTSIVAILFLGFSGHSYIIETVFAEKSPLTSLDLKGSVVEFESEQTKMQLNHEINELLPVSGNIENSVESIIEPPIPHVKMDELLTYSIEKGSVALTFDDGPSKYTKEIVDILIKYNVGGTFFFIGHNVKKHPNIVQYVDANNFSIGNHSMSHKEFTKLSNEKKRLELIETNQLIEQIINAPVVLFRPPYGSKDQSTIDLTRNNNMKMVLWNKDTEDWRSQNSDKIMNSIASSKSSGTIILLHESQAVVDTLPKIIEYLQNQDLQLVSLK
ncbi:polysaccharide deacetylase family protein [Bacillus sp. FJAT-29790]|uniref:polysaccharide deacetylase family protein n=1 Tax=Bacillus sp. FJAT-29790 TaxID=1895002 RepID=UPI001C229344|nr:polysaccharide deacetylase family protein [Bacillus sp. FJAT-29790]MBU8880405.1 polysaccharide deacetylase family protein [Bacillus sp. FJAT-29790]